MQFLGILHQNMAWVLSNDVENDTPSDVFQWQAEASFIRIASAGLSPL